jgi:ribonuclease VapC
MADVILDSSAVLAFLNHEAGRDRVADALAVSLVSAVNHAEVLEKLVERGRSIEDAVMVTDTLTYEIANVDVLQAFRAAALRAPTRHRGISLGDRFCLALAQEMGLPVLTADRAWQDLGLDVEITLIR